MTVIIIKEVLGNKNQDTLWKARLQKASLDVLTLSQSEAQKSRSRKTTRNGKDLGIILDRSTTLSDGDVLLWDEATNSAIVVEVQLQRVMIIQADSLLSKDPNSLLEAAFNLGHALGNQHWKSVVKDGQVFIPVVVTEKIMETVFKNCNFNLPYSFVNGEDILPLLSPSEVRLLFSSTEDTTAHIHVADSFQVSKAC